LERVGEESEMTQSMLGLEMKIKVDFEVWQNGFKPVKGG